MRILLVGGIFGRAPAYRAAVLWTPETTLEQGLRSRGHDVATASHSATFRLTGYDVVHVHHLGLGAVRAAADRSRVPFVFTAHNAERRILRTQVLGEVFRRADAVVALSKSQWDLEETNKKIGGTVHRVIPNGVADERFAGAAVRERGPMKRLLFAGQLTPMKRLDVLLHAIALVSRPDVRLVLAYHVDDQLGQVRQLVQDLGLTGQVQFLGRLNQSELALEYARAHALVLSSDNDALPSVVTESFLSGTPVVATDVGSVRDQVGTFGLVVPKGDPQAFAAAIERMLGNYEHFESRRSEMVAYARLRFSVDAMVFEHERLYAELSLASAQPRRLRVKPAGRSSINVLLKAYEIRSKVRTFFGARLHEPFRSSRIS